MLLQLSILIYVCCGNVSVYNTNMCTMNTLAKYCKTILCISFRNSVIMNFIFKVITTHIDRMAWLSTFILLWSIYPHWNKMVVTLWRGSGWYTQSIWQLSIDILWLRSWDDWLTEVIKINSRIQEHKGDIYMLMQQTQQPNALKPLVFSTTHRNMLCLKPIAICYVYNSSQYFIQSNNNPLHQHMYVSLNRN